MQDISGFCLLVFICSFRGGSLNMGVEEEALSPSVGAFVWVHL